MTEIVRRTLHVYRRQAAGSPDSSFDALLDRTRGIWRQGDGLAYQEDLRAEWEAR